MEGKTSSFVDELYSPKLAALSSNSDILSSVSPQSSSCAGKGSLHYASSASTTSERNLRGDFPSSNGKNRVSGASPHDSPNKPFNSHKKNNSPAVPCEIAEPCFMSSSVHYGGRDDFISDNISKNSQSLCSHKQKEDDLNNLEAATRGEWWQGSFYY